MKISIKFLKIGLYIISFKENSNLIVNNKIYNIQNVETINSHEVINNTICNKEINNSIKNKNLIFIRKESTDFRLKFNELDLIYEIYLYVKYFIKKTKEEKIPIDKIISCKTNC